MPLPLSKTQVDKLGDRLVNGGSDADLDTLEQVLLAYQEELDHVQVRLRELGVPAVTRVKTTGTLIDKLSRERGMRLSRVQDIAGARVVCPPGRDQQDKTVQLVVQAFSDSGRVPVVKDRRAVPSHGYRAVHVMVVSGGITVEVQIRTPFQDFWAQVVERLGDRWGRGLRYGHLDEPDAIVSSDGQVSPERWSWTSAWM